MRPSSRWAPTRRLDCVLGTAGLIRGALTQAVHHARHRRAFGNLLVDQPLMQNVLADLALESRGFDGARAAPCARVRRKPTIAALLRRVLTPAAKFWVCKRGPHDRRRGDGSLGRQRLRRGGAARTHVPADAAQLDLGRLGQRACASTCCGRSRGSRAASKCSPRSSPRRAPANADLDRFADTLLHDLATGPGTESTARVVSQRIALAVQGALLVSLRSGGRVRRVLRVAPGRRALRRWGVRDTCIPRRGGRHRASRLGRIETLRKCDRSCSHSRSSPSMRRGPSPSRNRRLNSIRSSVPSSIRRTRCSHHGSCPDRNARRSANPFAGRYAARAPARRRSRGLAAAVSGLRLTGDRQRDRDGGGVQDVEQPVRAATVAAPARDQARPRLGRILSRGRADRALRDQRGREHLRRLRLSRVGHPRPGLRDQRRHLSRLAGAGLWRHHAALG